MLIDNGITGFLFRNCMNTSSRLSLYSAFIICFVVIM
ncbi:hypothetical protein BVRB_1g000070 [Beta vulgaris subsp. vulgaris]|nr:hypothetical protein BVRB_1g000070 [Beta vulgaris subsp. vulgaris]